jgi:multicomponent Na+:H+ antiporter subunit E
MTIVRFASKLLALFVLIVYFIWEVIRANLRVAFDVLTLKHYMRPGILAIPLEAKTNLEITVLANMISLTPGTLSLDVSSDRKVLYVHAMYLEEPEEFKRFERRLLRVLR